MPGYTFPATERVFSGVGSVSELSGELERLRGARVLVLSTPSLEGSRAESLVLEAVGDRCVAVSHDAVQHVPVAAVDRLIALGSAVTPDVVVTVGGGSVTDAAKALAAALADGCDDATSLRTRRIVFEYPDSLQMPRLSADPIPLLAVPTTLSAAEYDGIFGMTFDGTKDLYNDRRLTPRSVFLDPRVTVETPEQLWRASGIRALDHAVEIYLSKAPTPVTDAASLHALRLLCDHLGRDDDASRLLCLQAAWLSMFGVDNVTLGLSHGIGHQIGARCGVPHGVTSCVMLPTVLERMVEVMPERLADIAAIFEGDRGMGGLAGGLAGVDGAAAPASATRSAPELSPAARAPGLVRGFIAGLGLPTRLSEVGVREADYELIAEDAMGDFVVAFSPVTVTKEDVVALLARAA
jgi:alcohol dehydrogenase class IV